METTNYRVEISTQFGTWDMPARTWKKFLVVEAASKSAAIKQAREWNWNHMAVDARTYGLVNFRAIETDEPVDSLTF